MRSPRKLLAVATIAGAALAPLSTAEAFWGFWPGSWFDGWGGFSFHMGTGWHGWGRNGWSPWYGGYYPYYGYPGWGYPYWGLPGYGPYGFAPYAAAPPATPATTTEK